MTHVDPVHMQLNEAVITTQSSPHKAQHTLTNRPTSILTNINNTNIDIVHNQAHWESAKGYDSMEHLIDEAELTAVLQIQSEDLYSSNRKEHFALSDNNRRNSRITIRPQWQ